MDISGTVTIFIYYTLFLKRLRSNWTIIMVDNKDLTETEQINTGRILWQVFTNYYTENIWNWWAG